MLKDIVKKYIDDWNSGAPSKYNCAEVILRSMNDYYDLSMSEDELKMAAGFGGGMKVGSVCGILTGAVMGLSRIYRADNPEIKAKLSLKTTQLMKAFVSKYGSDICFHVIDNGCIDMIFYTSDLIEDICN